MAKFKDFSRLELCYCRNACLRDVNVIQRSFYLECEEPETIGNA